MAMMDIMKRHMGNISRAVNNDVSVKYDYSIDKDSIINRYMQMRNELGYPLQVDSRNRRAVVYNKKGVEKEIQNLVDKCILSEVKQMEEMIANDVVNLITYQLNGIPQFGNPASNSSAIKNFTKAFAIGLTKGLIDIYNDMINVNNK